MSGAETVRRLAGILAAQAGEPDAWAGRIGQAIEIMTVLRGQESAIVPLRADREMIRAARESVAAAQGLSQIELRRLFRAMAEAGSELQPPPGGAPPAPGSSSGKS